MEKSLKRFILKAEIGGDVFVGSDVKLLENNYNLINRNNRNVKCQLSGFRSEIGILIDLDILKKVWVKTSSYQVKD